jgi:hypothetical protein
MRTKFMALETHVITDKTLLKTRRKKKVKKNKNETVNPGTLKKKKEKH